MADKVFEWLVLNHFFLHAGHIRMNEIFSGKKQLREEENCCAIGIDRG